MQKAVEFKNSDGLTLRGFVYEPKKYDTAIVFLHGFPANCKYIVASNMGNYLERLGYLFLCFDFNGTDTSDGKFEDKLMSKEVKDVKYAIDFLSKNYKFNKLIIIGHSTGAIDAALYSYKDKRVDKLILLGGVGNLKQAVRYDFSDEDVHDFKTKDYIIYKNKNHWTYNKKLKRSFYDEFFTLDVLGSLHKFKKPVLIIHGSKDESVPVEKDPQELYSAANEPKKLIIINGADHKFSKLRHGLKVLYYINKFIKN